MGAPVRNNISRSFTRKLLNVMLPSKSMLFVVGGNFCVISLADFSREIAVEMAPAVKAP